MNANIGLKEPSRAKILALLDRLLADEYLLYTKTRNFHWNVTGPQFSDLHKFFEAQYELLDGFVDDTAERSRALGGRALGSMAGFLKAARQGDKTAQHNLGIHFAQMEATETAARQAQEENPQDNGAQ